MPRGLTEAISLFLASRAALTVIGVLAITLLGREMYGLQWEHADQRWLDIWGQWDTGWYLNIAQNWYSALPQNRHQCNYAFFPLYPALIRFLGALTGNFFHAGLIISNLSLLGAAMLLYRLVELDHGRDVAFSSVKYMFMWPVSFLLSGVLSESLFLFLLLGCFYSARKGKWVYAGLAGFLLALTRVNGVFVVIPLFYEYMREKDFRLKGIRADILALGLVPLGLLVYCAYNYILTGDFLAFVHIQSAWGRQMGNPLTILADGLLSWAGKPNRVVAAWLTGFTLASLAIFCRRIPFSHLLLCLIFIFLPLSSSLMSMPRFTAVLFPLFILFGRLSQDRRVDAALTLLLCILQGFFMVFWSTGRNLIV